MASWRRPGVIGLLAMVACAPKTRVAERFPARAELVRDVRAPSGGGLARFAVVSRGVRYERVHDGFGCVQGEIPTVGVLAAKHGARWEAHLYLRFVGRATPPGDDEGLRVQNARGGSTGMRTREDAIAGARDGEVQACWSADGTRFAYRTHHPAGLGSNAWTRVEWSPVARATRLMGRVAGCEAALTAAPDPP